MNCKDFKKNIKGFLNNKLSGNTLRQFYFHAKKCQYCKETLLDEYILYSVFNDLDKDDNFNYETKLDKELSDIGLLIEAKDKTDMLYYIVYSIIICIIGIIGLFFLVRFVF